MIMIIDQMVGGNSNENNISLNLVNILTNFNILNQNIAAIIFPRALQNEKYTNGLSTISGDVAEGYFLENGVSPTSNVYFRVSNNGKTFERYHIWKNKYDLDKQMGYKLAYRYNVEYYIYGIDFIDTDPTIWRFRYFIQNQ